MKTIINWMKNWLEKANKEAEYRGLRNIDLIFAEKCLLEPKAKQKIGFK